MSFFKIILLGCIGLSIGQKNFSQDTIQWRSDYKLKWDDFKGKVDSLSEHAAVSNVLIKFSFSNNNKDYTYKICCVFNKKKSWVRIPTCQVLIHEQGHFDIGEIFARKLRQTIQSYKFNPATVNQDLKKIFARIGEEKEAMDDLYDIQTDFHRNDSMQIKWNKRITAELFKLNKYAK